ncbi:hypothetical protein ACRRTK_001377 [Alexandromys fortis]
MFRLCRDPRKVVVTELKAFETSAAPAFSAPSVVCSPGTLSPMPDGCKVQEKKTAASRPSSTVSGPNSSHSGNKPDPPPVLRVDDRQRLARERREERDKQLEALVKGQQPPGKLSHRTGFTRKWQAQHSEEEQSPVLEHWL